MAKPTYYETLGVAHTASETDIKQAYRKLAREFHPDVNASADAEARFKEINLAYATLSDSLKRADYDQSLGETGVRTGGAPAGGPSARRAQTAPTYRDPNRGALIRQGLFRVVVMALISALAGMVLQAGLSLAAGTALTTSAVVFSSVPAFVIGALWGADLNFQVESFLGSGWLGRSYTFTRTVLMSLGLAFYGGLVGAAADQAIGRGPFLTAPLILLGVLVGAVFGSDGDTPEKLRSGAGRFNLFYTFLRGAEVGAIGALIGAALGGILIRAGQPDVFGWTVFVGFAIGMIAGSIKPPNLAAYASYASASIRNILILMLIGGALLVGLVGGVAFAPQLSTFLRLTG